MLKFWLIVRSDKSSVKFIINTRVGFCQLETLPLWAKKENPFDYYSSTKRLYFITGEVRILAGGS